jgi:hypothetical protein
MTHENTIQRRKAKGLCRCGRRPIKGKKTCRKCVTARVARNRERRARYRAEGRCRCGKKAIAGQKECRGCSARHAKAVAASQAKNRRAGLCACGRQAGEGKKSCESCLARRRRLAERHKANGICISCMSRKPAKGRAVCGVCREKNRIKGKDIRAKYRRAVLDHYGARCGCCGETAEQLLTLDHMDNDGKAHRLIVDGARLCRWIMKNGYPKNFQVLCMNCNWAKWRYGECPHQRQTTRS